ncbi:MAG: hypothetical protein E6R03_17420 [Hyphomicrobiaceae bacterium]|nr:MAG: hypothetical protein E6R03_17420 [Hyphomicrobiaceae bacterium]
MKALIVLFVFTFGLFAQEVKVVLDDGKAIHQTIVGEILKAHGLEVSIGKPVPGRYRVKIRNPGKSEWDLNSPQVGARIFIRSIDIKVPASCIIEWAAQKEAEPMGDDGWWNVLGDRHRRSIFPLVPESKQKHLLTGGETISWDLVFAPLPAPTPEALAKVRAILWHHDAFSLSQWPMREKLAHLWEINNDSFNPVSLRRNMGWRMRHWANRFAGNADGSTRVPNCVGPFDWGGVMWPDGHSSQHYDMPAAALDAYLLTGSPDSLRLAYLLTQHWINQSFIYTDVLGGTQHAIRYEKGHFLSNSSGGELGRPGNAGDSPPRESHAWGVGALAVGILTDDQDIKEVTRLRGEYRLSHAPAITPNGCRGFAWSTRDLAAYHLVTGDSRFRVKLIAEVDRAIRAAWPLGKKNGLGEILPAWPSERSLNERQLVEWDPWQHAEAVTAIVCASGLAAFQLTPVQQQAIIEIGVHTLEKGTRFVSGPKGPTQYLQGCMYRDRAYYPQYPTAPLEIWQNSTLTSNYFFLTHIAATYDPARYGERWRAACRTVGELVFGSFGTPVPPADFRMQADSDVWGLAGSKVFAEFQMGGRPWAFVTPNGVLAP